MREPELTTLCYIEDGDKYLMINRNTGGEDPNAGKWLGIGGHFSFGECPEECVRREVMEETGLTVSSLAFRGLITFVSDDGLWEYIHLFTAVAKEGQLPLCDEGSLEWVEKSRIPSLPLWEGDHIFLKLLTDGAPFFSLKLLYRDTRLSEVLLNGNPLPLPAPTAGCND